jgi:hypothetical protein
MSVSKHSTWNRTTSLARAYRGRSRRCHHPFNLPDYRVISTTVTAGRRQVIIETDQPRAARAAASLLPGARSGASSGSAIFLSPGRSCRRARGCALVQVPLVLRRTSLRQVVVLRIHATGPAPRPLYQPAPGPVGGCGHPVGQGRIGNGCQLRGVLVDGPGGAE